MRILYLLPALQHPTMRGSLRHYHILRLLARRHEVTLLVLAKEGLGEITSEALEEIDGMVARLEIFEANGPDRASANRDGVGPLHRLLLRARRTLGIRNAVMEMGAAATSLSRRQEFDVALCHGKELYPLTGDLGDLPLVMDACDATFLRRRALLRQTALPDLPWALLRYLRSLWVEHRLVRRASRITYISPRDRDAVLPRGRRARVVPNGIDLEYWRREGRSSEPDCLVLTGVMDYPPNVDGAKWVATEVLPRIRQSRPSARLLLVGRDPTPELRELEEREPAVTVTGYVEDLRPWLARGEVFVAGLRAASGQQNKVLEAMAMEVPVAATPAVAAGFRLDGAGEPPVRVAGTADALADAVVDLLRDREARRRLARRGRAFVEENFDWERSAAALEEECLAAAGRPESASTDAATGGGRPDVAPEEARGRLRRGLRGLQTLFRVEGERWAVPGWAAALLALMPFLVVAATGAAALEGKAAYKWIIREDGLAETLQVLAWLGTAAFGLVIGRRLRREGASWEGWLYAAVGIAALFVVGEEISWGQRLVGWSTPEQLAAANRQGETNIHNLHSVEVAFRWAKILAGAWGCLLPILLRPLDPTERMVARHAAPRSGPVRRGGRAVRLPASDLLVPPQFLATFFAFPFVWGLYRMFAPRPPAFEWAIAEFGEIVELQLALGAFLFLFLVRRRRSRGGVRVPGDGRDDGARRATSVREVLEGLEHGGVDYVVLRGNGRLTGDHGGDGTPDPYATPGVREIDLLAARSDLPALAREAARMGFVTLPSFGHEPHHFFVRWEPERGGWLKLDVVTDLRYGRRAFTLSGPDDPAEILRRGRRVGGIRFSRAEDEFTTLLTHCLLDAGRVEERHRERLSALRGELRADGREEELERRVEHALGPAVSWSRVLHALDRGAWDGLVERAPELRRQYLRADAVGTAGRAVRAWCRRALRPVLALLRRHGFSVALLAPDGAGKTTLARSVERRSPIRCRVVYMGINRSAATVHLPGADRAARRADRLRSSAWRAARWPGRGLGFAVRLSEQLWRSAVARMHRAAGHLVIFDRFTYDAWRSGEPAGLKSRIRRWLLEVPAPRPDQVIVLDVPAEVLVARKDEHTMDELQSQRRGYLALAGRLPVPVEVVDASRTREAVFRDVMSLVWHGYVGRPGMHDIPDPEHRAGTSPERTSAGVAE